MVVAWKHYFHYFDRTWLREPGSENLAQERLRSRKLSFQRPHEALWKQHKDKGTTSQRINWRLPGVYYHMATIELKPH